MLESNPNCAIISANILFTTKDIPAEITSSNSSSQENSETIVSISVKKSSENKFSNPVPLNNSVMKIPTNSVTTSATISPQIPSFSMPNNSSIQSVTSSTAA